MKKIIAVLLLMFSASLHAEIDDSSAEILQFEITEYEEYVQDAVCIPDDLSASQASAIVAKYISDNPDINHTDAIVVASNALLYAFPCGDT